MTLVWLISHSLLTVLLVLITKCFLVHVISGNSWWFLFLFKKIWLLYSYVRVPSIGRAGTLSAHSTKHLANWTWRLLALSQYYTTPYLFTFRKLNQTTCISTCETGTFLTLLSIGQSLQIWRVWVLVAYCDQLIKCLLPMNSFLYVYT